MRSRTTRTRRWTLLATVMAMVLALAACGGGNGGETPTGDDGTAAADGGGLLAELQERGSITIGIANEVPYGYEDEEGNVTGEAPEVAKRVLQEMGIEEVDAEIVDFGALISGLQAGQFDMIAAGMYINEDRAEQILFSDPDYCVGEAFAVPEGNPEGLTDFESVADNPDVTIAVLSGAVEEGYAEDAGIPDSQIELFSDVNAQYDALDAGRVDAVTGTSLTVRTQAEAREGIEATDSFFPKDAEGEPVLGCGGFGFRKENQEFRDAYNETLNELQEQGEIKPIVESFGFDPDDIDRAEDLTVEEVIERAG